MHTVSQLGRGGTLCQYDVAAAEVGEDCGKAVHGGFAQCGARRVSVCEDAEAVEE